MNIKERARDSIGDLTMSRGMKDLIIHDLLAEIERFKTALATIAAQSSAIPGSTNRADCMAALASAALRRLEQA